MDLDTQLMEDQKDSSDEKTLMEVEETPLKEVSPTTFVKPEEARNPSCMQSSIPNFNAISNVDKAVINSQSKDTWELQTPQPIRASKNVDESYSQQNDNTDKVLLKCSFTRSCSAFASTDKTDSNKNSLKKLMDDMNSFKRCNSAPLFEADDSAVPMSPINLVNEPRTNRSRCMSASVSSPKSALPVPVKSRLINQLIKEESLEGIQNKEKEHEREVQVNFQISSNWRDFSLTDGDKPDANDVQIKLSNINQRPMSSPLTGPQTRNQSLYLPATTRPCRAIDFNNLSSSIPSPLTFLHSPTSPTRPTSACSMVPGMIGRQIYSPIVRNSSRSPSPSPTRKNFITRRRSQSPVVKPSALGNTLKRKYDSDNEYCISPKRLNVTTTTTNAPETTRNSFTHIRIKQFQKPSSLLNTTPMLVDNTTNPTTTTSCTSVHNTSNSVFHRVIQTPTFGNLLNGLNFNSERCSSPASSTCSSSSLEGLKDIQPFLHHPYTTYNSPKKNFKQVGDND